jgi:hypothetical protein
MASVVFELIDEETQSGPGVRLALVRMTRTRGEDLHGPPTLAQFMALTIQRMWDTGVLERLVAPYCQEELKAAVAVSAASPGSREIEKSVGVDDAPDEPTAGLKALVTPLNVP